MDFEDLKILWTNISLAVTYFYYIFRAESMKMYLISPKSEDNIHFQMMKILDSKEILVGSRNSCSPIKHLLPVRYSCKQSAYITSLSLQQPSEEDINISFS